MTLNWFFLRKKGGIRTVHPTLIENKTAAMLSCRIYLSREVDEEDDSNSARGLEFAQKLHILYA